MNTRTWMNIGIVALACSLGACSSHKGPDPAAAPATSATTWLAVARGRVDVQGGMAEVVAQTGGVVAAVDADPGEHVEAGQVLARLDSRAAKIGVAIAKTHVAAAEAQLTELAASLAQARWNAQHLAAAAKEGTATGAAAVAARATVQGFKAKRDAARQSLAARQHQLAQAQLTLDETSLRAPVAGIVVTRAIALGQAVAASSGPPLFKLLPDRPYIVRTQVDAQVANHLRPGMQAEVVRDSGSGPVYAATVLRVGKVLQAAVMAPSPLERALANDVDCTLQLAPPKAGVVPLNVGQLVDVKFPRPAR